MTTARIEKHNDAHLDNEIIHNQLNELKSLLMEKYQTGKIEIIYDPLTTPDKAKIMFQDEYEALTAYINKESKNRQAIFYLSMFGDAELAFAESKAHLTDNLMWTGYSSQSILTINVQYCQNMIEQLKLAPAQDFASDESFSKQFK